jgi:hypothetical protein
MLAFTAETQRTQRKAIFVCREIPTNKKDLLQFVGFWPKVIGLMENRHLPILHKHIPLRALRLKRVLIEDEWVLKI